MPGPCTGWADSSICASITSMLWRAGSVIAAAAGMIQLAREVRQPAVQAWEPAAQARVSATMAIHSLLALGLRKQDPRWRCGLRKQTLAGIGLTIRFAAGLGPGRGGESGDHGRALCRAERVRGRVGHVGRRTKNCRSLAGRFRPGPAAGSLAGNRRQAACGSGCRRIGRCRFSAAPAWCARSRRFTTASLPICSSSPI